MKRFLGIDYGASKVGLALGDSEIKIATPFKIISPQELFLEIERLIERGEGLDVAVMGLPLGLNNQETESTKMVKEAGAALAQKISIPLLFEDERFSTAQARQNLKNLGGRSRDDAVAAMHILQSYLNRTYGHSHS